MAKPQPLAITLLVLILAVAGLLWTQRESFFPSQIQLTPAEESWILANRGGLVAAGEANYPPVDFADESGRHQGIADDILSLVETRTGLSFRRSVYPNFGAVLQASREREIDLVCAAVSTPERQTYLAFTQHYLSIPTIWVVNQTRTDLRSAADLKGKRVAVTASYATWTHFLALPNRGFDMVPAASDADALTRVATGQVDAAICDLPTTSWLANRLHIGQLRVLGETGFVWDFSFGVPKSETLLLGILNKGLASIGADERNAIMERWISVEYSNVFYNARTWMTIFIIIGVTAALALLVLLWDRSLRYQVKLKTKELNDYKEGLEREVAARTRDLAEANRQLSILAVTDALTGCFNRRHFMEAGEREHQRALRSGHPYALLMFDLDHFKRINDSYGHAMGDATLKAVVQVVTGALRQTDLLGRIGGEEFYILLPDTDLEQARYIAERHRQAIQAIDSLQVHGKALAISASFGVCQFDPRDQDFNQCMQRADSALYQAKAAGRNCVQLAHHPDAST